VGEPRLSVGLPQLVHDQAPDVMRRYTVRAEELGFARPWSLDSVPGSATARVPLLDGLHVLSRRSDRRDRPRRRGHRVARPQRGCARQGARDNRSAERRPADRECRSRTHRAHGGWARIAHRAPRADRECRSRTHRAHGGWARIAHRAPRAARVPSNCATSPAPELVSCACIRWTVTSSSSRRSRRSPRSCETTDATASRQRNPGAFAKLGMT
jgi:hypothetical protein